jgi:hypothetical protein
MMAQLDNRSGPTLWMALAAVPLQAEMVLVA